MLDEEIKERRQDISTDSYGMSVGEIISLYRDKELRIRPEFQRFFRWSKSQKSRFIESLLLGIPIPPIFVSQDENGKWDVIDGLQRLSTILELTGDLVGEDGVAKEPLILTKTDYLPSLNGKKWNSDNLDQNDELSESAKLLIKRARLDVKIVLNSSGASSKYELFDRLNTGGSIATDQEVRNCILIMLDKSFFEWMSDLGKNANFKACLPLTDRQLQEQFDLELLVRFLTLRTVTDIELAAITDLGPFLTKKIAELATNGDYDRDNEAQIFARTFELLADSLGEDSFKKYNLEKGRAMGPVLISLFEVIALGLGFHIGNEGGDISPDDIIHANHKAWENEAFVTGTGSGVRATSRMPVTIPMGRAIFQK